MTRLVQCCVLTSAPLFGSASAVSPASSRAPAPPPALIDVITPIRQQMRHHLGTVRYRPAVTRKLTGIPCASTAKCIWYWGPFSATNGLIAAHRAGAMLMRFDIAGVNHQPLQVRRVNHGFQQLGPDAFLAPAMATDASRVPMSKVRWQVAPGRAGAEYPEHGLLKTAAVLCRGRREALGRGCSRRGRMCRGDDRRRFRT